MHSAKLRGLSVRKMKHFVSIITILFLVSCREDPVRLSRIAASQARIDSSVVADDSLHAFIAPYRNHMEDLLNAPLAYAPRKLVRTDGDLNSSIGNLLADLVLEQSDSLRRLQGKSPVDFVLLNHGGIRSIISEGTVSRRTAYEVMPFENTIQVVPMRGAAVREMLAYLVSRGRPHPVSGIKIRLGPDGTLNSVDIGGLPFDEDRTYYVATSNYLVSGGDGMTFFEQGGPPEDTGYKIRNAMIDYFERVDTLQASVDDRFLKMPSQ